MFSSIRKADKSKLLFVFINSIVAILRFGRSFIFMKYLDFTELGIITLIFTVVGFFGMFQIGFLNGGYRILSVEPDTHKRLEINNIIYTYFLILFVLIIITVLILKYFTSTFDVNFFLMLIAVFVGLITLINNWIGNILSAFMNFKVLNILELVSTATSLLFLFTVPIIGFKGAMLTVISQPLIFLIIAFIKYNYVRPTNILFDLKKVKWILTFGFIPFLSGIFLQVNNQIENWSILYFLDVESLGKFYLPAIFTSLFMLIPFSVGKLFFPPAMRNFVNKDFSALKKILKNYFIFILVFISFAFIITYFFLEPVVRIVFPKHLVGIKYVWYIFPGLIALLLLEPLGLLFNASVKLKPMFWAYLSSCFVMLILIFVGNRIFGFSLSLMACIKSFIGLYITLFLYIIFFIKKDYFLSINSKVVYTDI